MFRARGEWIRISKRVRIIHTRNLHTSNTKPMNGKNSDKVTEGSIRDLDAYRQLDKLDFMTAAKILFTAPPNKKKFGIDFHLVQLFFACMPSLAVYLVAQYARYEIRRMEAEMEVKKKAEEEKAKEIERQAAEEKEKEIDPKLLEVKVRLDKLEETVKEIAVYSKKESISGTTKTQEDGTEKKHIAETESNKSETRSQASNSATKDNLSEQNSQGSKK